MWAIAPDATGYVVSIGDPRKGGSKIQHHFTTADDLKWWVKDEVGNKVSEDHIVDLTGMGLVPDKFSNWFVEVSGDQVGLTG
jgi:hypothetical protein